MMRRTTRGLAFALALGLAACVQPPEQRLYVLEPPASSLARAAAAAPAGLSVVALREADLPAYARAAQMAVLAEDGAITQSDVARWADAPPRAVTGALASLVAAKTGADAVVEPWPREAAPEAIVSVRVDRFVGALGGDLTLAGRFSVIGAAGRGERASQTFSFTVETDGPGFDALARAHGRALDLLADRIAAALG